jgi:hypothetical protein
MPEIDFAALTPLIAFALWCVLLMFSLGFARMGAMRAGRGVETFKPVGDTDQLDAHSRAHMNAAAENLPIFAVVYLSALWVDAAAPVAALGWTVFAARVVQSSVHIISRSPNAVRVRAFMQLIQALCYLWLGGAAIYWANAG